MPRRPREEEEGALNHVYGRGNDRRRIFRDDADHEAYLRQLAQVVSWFGWYCLAYCLMPNHVHLIIETPRANLGAGMQRLHGQYATRFNRRHGRSGHLFQGPYGATRIKDDAHLWTVVPYVVNNPVRAELAVAAADWRWGSQRAVVKQEIPEWLAVGRLFDYLAGAGGDGR